jgi:hypothetical protein
MDEENIEYVEENIKVLNGKTVASICLSVFVVSTRISSFDISLPSVGYEKTSAVQSLDGHSPAHSRILLSASHHHVSPPPLQSTLAIPPTTPPPSSLNAQTPLISRH